MTKRGSMEARGEMLAEWYLQSVRRYDWALRSERTRNAIRVMGHMYYVTGEQLHRALDAAYSELHTALPNQESWGMDRDGRPLEIAIAGLAQRRLRARLIDEIRRGERRLELVGLPEGDGAGSVAPSRAGDPFDHAGCDVTTALSGESDSTQAVLVLAAAGWSCPEIAMRLGLTPAAVRQRISRFGKRCRRAEREAA